MEIVQAGLAELDLIVPLFDGYRQFYKKPSDVAAAREFLQARLENSESIIYLALIDGQAAGFTQLYPIFSSTKLKRAWLLNDLFVHPDFRGKGVGEALLERARQLGVETNSNHLMLETAVDNFPAQRLYERAGWVRETLFYTYNLDF